MGKRTKYFLLVLVLIIAAFLRFYHLPSAPPGLYPDEAVNGNDGAAAAATGDYKVFYTENNGREGLYMDLIGLEFQFFGAPHEPWVVRLPAAIAGTLTVLGFYLFVAELLGDGAGLLAALLMATSFWAIDFSRIGFRAILAPLFLIWALWFFLRAIRAPAADGRRAAWYAILAGAAYGLGFYSYIAYRITPLLFLFFIPFFACGAQRTPNFWKRTLLFVIATFIVAAPIGWYFAKNPPDFLGRTSEISVATASNPAGQFLINAGKELLMFNWRGDANWRHNISGAPELYFPVGILFLVGIALAIWSLVRRKKKANDSAAQPYGERVPSDATGPPSRTFPIVLTFAWFILALLPAALSNESIPHALRSILMLPPALILASMGGIWIYRFIKKWNFTTALAVAIIFATTITAEGYCSYFLTWAENPNVPGAFAADYVAIGRAINALPTSTPKYVVVEAGGVPVNGIPMPAETTIYITDTFTPAGQAAKNVHYLLPNETGTIPSGTPITDIFYIQ